MRTPLRVSWRQDTVLPPGGSTEWRRRFGEVLLQKQELIEWLVNNGDEAKTWDIEDSLPEVLDTEKHRDLLAEHGIDVESIRGRR